jgi:hypothetical protein
MFDFQRFDAVILVPAAHNFATATKFETAFAIK